MSENVIFALIPIFALLIPITAIAARTVRRMLEVKERAMEIAATTAGEQAAQHAARIERLEARVHVLERIATDKPAALAAEIENLRLPQTH